MRSFMTVIQVLMWALAAWLFVGLLGTMRWLSPSAELGPDALAAMVFKVVALGLFIGGWALSARISAGPPAQRSDALPWATQVKPR